MTDKKNGLAQSRKEQLVFIRGNHPFTTSRKVAIVFGKEHRHVLRDVEILIENTSKDVSKSGHIFSENDPSIFLLENFVRANFKDSYGREQPEYHLTKDGFTLLVMGYTGAKAMSFKIAYIEKFNAMEERLRQREERQLVTMKDFVRIGEEGFDAVMKPIPVYIDENDRNVHPYLLTLEKMGYSTRSGSVYRRQNRFPLMFATVDGILCITSAYAEQLYLLKLAAHNGKVLHQVQLAFNFKQQGGSHDNHN